MAAICLYMNHQMTGGGDYRKEGCEESHTCLYICTNIGHWLIVNLNTYIQHVSACCTNLTWDASVWVIGFMCHPLFGFQGFMFEVFSCAISCPHLWPFPICNLLWASGKSKKCLLTRVLSDAHICPLNGWTRMVGRIDENNLFFEVSFLKYGGRFDLESFKSCTMRFPGDFRGQWASAASVHGHNQSLSWWWSWASPSQEHFALLVPATAPGTLQSCVQWAFRSCSLVHFWEESLNWNAEITSVVFESARV